MIFGCTHFEWQVIIGTDWYKFLEMHWKLVRKTACKIPIFLKVHEFAIDFLWQWEYASHPICQYELFFLQKFYDWWHHCFPISTVTVKSVEIWVGWMWYQLRLSWNKNRDIWSHLFHRFKPLLGGHQSMFSNFLQAAYKMATECRFICSRHEEKGGVGDEFWFAMSFDTTLLFCTKAIIHAKAIGFAYNGNNTPLKIFHWHK